MRPEENSGARSTPVDVAKQLHKTKICKHFLKDKCRFGADCSYAHCQEEQRGRPDLRKTKLCRLFEQGRCRENDCGFAHGPQELRGTVGVWKTVMCSKYASGQCRAGRQCRFAHGEQELQEPRQKQQQQEMLHRLPVPAAPFGYGGEYPHQYAYHGGGYPAPPPDFNAYGGPGGPLPGPAGGSGAVEAVAHLVSLTALMSEGMDQGHGGPGPGGPVNEERARHIWPPTPDFVPTPIRPSVDLPRPLSPLSPEAMQLIPPSLFSPESNERVPRGPPQ